MSVGPVPRTIPYTPVNWVDGVTPVNAENLNHMEDLLEALASAPAPSGGGVKYENAWAAPTPYKQGDVVIHNGVEYIAVNDSTGQTPPAVPGLSGAPLVIGMGTSLPASPFDGQEYILTDSLTAPTFSWRFRYVAAKASNKWVYVGGVPLLSEVTAAEVATGGGFTSYSDLGTPGPSLVVPVAGEYSLTTRAAVIITAAAAGTPYVSPKLGAAVALDADAWLLALTTGGDSNAAHRTIKRVLAAATTVKLQYRNSVAGMNTTISQRQLLIEPVAVGG